MVRCYQKEVFTMSYKLASARVTLWVNRCIAALVLILLPTLPFLLDWYSTVRVLSPSEYLAIVIAFYCCAVVTGIALWQMDRLLRNILEGQVFVAKNVRCIRRIRLCCALISLICLPAAFVYLPLWFMVIIMAFLCLVVNVVAQVMDAAVAIREENDLTI